MIVGCPACKTRYDVSGRPPGREVVCKCSHRFVIPEADDEAPTRACGSCGASVSTTATECPYCTSPVASVRCHSCLGIVAAGARHCQHCGARVEDAAVRLMEGKPRDAHCPRCKSVHLETLVTDSLAVDHCKSCGGLWLDHRVFAELQKSKEADAPMMTRIAKLPTAPGPENERAYIPCPECGSLMNRRNFASSSGIIVDECRAHGVWFDQGELADILSFVRDGGLDRAREKDRLRHEEDMRRKKFGAKMDNIRDMSVNARVAHPRPRWSRQEWSLVDAASLIGRLFG